MISAKYGCLFIHIPKCAGTSIEKALGHFDNFNGRNGQDHRTYRNIECSISSSIMNVFENDNFSELLRTVYYRSFKPLPNPNSNMYLSDLDFQRVYKFTVVRNPWARTYSWFKNVIRDKIHLKKMNVSPDIDFKSFLRGNLGKSALRPQLYWLKDNKGNVNMDYIIRFEELQAGFDDVCDHLNIPKVSLPHEIKSDKLDDYRDAYDEESKELVAEYFKEEIKLFGYKFN